MTTHPALSAFQSAAATATTDGLRAAIADTFAADATVKMCAPFGDVTAADAFETLYAPLLTAMPDLERRDMITLTGTTAEGETWAGHMGNYMGTMTAPWSVKGHHIPLTGHLTHMRYHEFFRIKDGKVTEAQIIWDIPEVMMQAHAWPMAPQLGKALCTPAPMTQDGLTATGDGQATMDHVIAMLTDLCKHPAQGGPEVMNLEAYWHPRFNWYGPHGIGTGRGIAGFRNWHQIPFLRAMPDRKLDAMGDLMSHWFAQGDYVCETGWPNMRLTLTDDGWMGTAPAGREVLLRSLDFWRMENGKIRENWVLVDLLDLYAQCGVDVLARMSEFNKARNLGPIRLPESQF
ncbi:ester cyclase [Pseudooctadecabacter jejudonensis]|uniref:SnoaL-like domain protein n=1 Tax=Pseudooctadecabacter jejudonensis TaxID=1391910 RepID=A0A1Y5SH81_9RHOB|nr:nuclear transport factor 2 family protein [Pseudooctadecabacter jejudonensis]SLN40437.1 SnoaL-like domain protein [Pseudooctadecabacter jejudonensis]